MEFKEKVLDCLGDYILSESIGKPTELEKKRHKEYYPDDGRLFYVVRDSVNRGVLTYIDEKYIKKLSSRKGRDVSPREAARIRLGQIKHFKKKS